jgi:hypothetical protein
MPIFRLPPLGGTEQFRGEQLPTGSQATRKYVLKPASHCYEVRPVSLFQGFHFHTHTAVARCRFSRGTSPKLVDCGAISLLTSRGQASRKSDSRG